MQGKKETGTPGPLPPDRSQVPDSDVVVTSDAGVAPTDVVEPFNPLHKHTNTVEGLLDPNAEAKAPGRPTHGANNNG